MGESTQFRCPECGYDFAAFTGVGCAFPRVYAETVSKMKRGRLGATAKRFFEEHPDGAISCENVVMKCQKCGEYDSREYWAMYVPKEGFAYQVPGGIWAFAAPFEGATMFRRMSLKHVMTFTPNTLTGAGIAGGK